jgi:hypothetical protein
LASHASEFGFPFGDGLRFEAGAAAKLLVADRVKLIAKINVHSNDAVKLLPANFFMTFPLFGPHISIRCELSAEGLRTDLA